MSLVVSIDELFSNGQGILAKANHWERIELGKIVRIINGYPLKSTLFNKSSGFPIIRIRDLKFNKTETFTSEDFPKEYIVSNGDLLIGMDGDFVCYKWSGGKAVLNQRVCKLIASEEFIDPQFLFYAINGYLSAIHEVTSSVTVKHLSSLDILRIPFPIPPRQEQQRIVAKLDDLMEKIDRSRARLERIPKILKRFRQSILSAAVSGKLTEGWRDRNYQIENARDLITKIKEIRTKRYKEACEKAKNQGRRKPSDYDNYDVNLRGDFELFDIPESWSWLDFRFVMAEDEPFCYGVVQPGSESKDGNFLIRAGDLKNNTVETSALRTISKTVDNEYSRSRVNGGEILITVVGAGIGECGVVPESCKGYNIARAVAKVPIKDFNIKCVLFWLNSSNANKWMKTEAREVARPTLNLEQLRTIPLPLPPIQEQIEIERRVEQLLLLADKIEARYNKAKADLDKLPQSLLAKAFRGELVTQDENDEPASVLLARINDKLASRSVKKTRSKEYKIEPPASVGIAAESNSKYAESVSIKIPENKRAFAKQVLSGKIVSLFKDDPHFTHIKFQKLQYLAEHLAEVDLNWNYYRQSAGPYDPKFMHTVAFKLKVSKWFEERKYRFYPLEKVDKIEGYYEGYFKPVATRLDSLFSALKQSTEDEAEIVATLYAVWNNMIIKKEHINDDVIVSTFFEWSDRKKKYTQPQVSKALGWMKKNGFAPTGFGKVIKEKKP